MGSLSYIQWFIFFLVVAVGLLPTIIATHKNHPYKVAITLVNIFGLVLFGLGWIIALVWCFITPKNERTISRGTTEEIERLHQLKVQGALTQEEFDAQKKIIFTR